MEGCFPEWVSRNHVRGCETPRGLTRRTSWSRYYTFGRMVSVHDLIDVTREALCTLAILVCHEENCTEQKAEQLNTRLTFCYKFNKGWWEKRRKFEAIDLHCETVALYWTSDHVKTLVYHKKWKCCSHQSVPFMQTTAGKSIELNTLISFTNSNVNFFCRELTSVINCECYKYLQLKGSPGGRKKLLTLFIWLWGTWGR